MSPVGNGARFAAAPISGGGTAVAEWLDWGGAIPALDLDECPGLLLVAPHPDDETLGFGATAALLRSRGVEVTVVSVTDGGASVPGLSPVERRRLERDRRAELFAAVEVLGLDEPVCLGLPDGEVTEAEGRLTASLAELIGAGPAGLWCAATWRGDGHPDHEAVGRAAAAATAGTDAVLLEYPVWMWHWAAPGDDAVPWDRMLMAPLDQESAERKRQAVTAFDTQLDGSDAILPPFVLDRLFAIGEAVIR